MQMTQSQHGTITVLTVSGRIDTSNYTEFEEQVIAKIDEEHKRIVFDFTDLVYLSSAGLRALLKISQELTQVGGQIAYTSVSEYIADIFKIAGFSKVYRFFDSAEEALKYLK